MNMPLSNYVKGDLELELLLQSQRTLIMCDYGKELKTNQYTDEGLELAGIADLSKITKKEMDRNDRIRRTD